MFFAPLCGSRYRAALAGSGFFAPGANLPESEFTLPDAFAAAGSSYSLLSIGKWHIGGGIDGAREGVDCVALRESGRLGWTGT